MLLHNRMSDFPTTIGDEPALDEVLTRPREELVRSIRSLASPLVILGAGGKMGPTLALLAKRAADAAAHPLEICAISRFSDAASRDWLERNGIRTIACDLLAREELARLPDSTNLVYLVGLKFGTQQDPASTWAINTLVPAFVAERYRSARIVALSTGNVYPLAETSIGGVTEAHPLTPAGEYPNAAVARERILQFYSQKQGTPISLLRLLYAVELRYGVIMDIGRKVCSGQEIDLATGFFNCIWQGDANEFILRAFELAQSPPSVWNLCRPEIFSVRKIALRFADLLGTTARFRGEESATALLASPRPLLDQLGEPPTPIEPILRWTADWIKRGGRSLGKPTHFEVRDGQY